MAEKYILRVTAGPDYDMSTHVEVPVNTATAVDIKGPLMDVSLNVRIQNYEGLPRNSPNTSSYFSAEPHATNRDQYSIAFRFMPKAPEKDSGKDDSGEDEKEDDDDDEEEDEEGISGADLQFGNDFDHPIRDRLPPGFNTALNIVKWWIDPGLEGDAYADVPHLYGPALSSFNSLRCHGENPTLSASESSGDEDAEQEGIWVYEGGEGAGLEARKAAGMPDDAKSRMRWALGKEAKENWLWRYGETYAVDFYNPYLDFSGLALKLPGFSVPIMKYWDGQGLR
jgi:hypothetical protein